MKRGWVDEEHTVVDVSICISWSALQWGKILFSKLISVSPTSPRCDRLSIALRTQSSSRDTPLISNQYNNTGLWDYDEESWKFKELKSDSHVYPCIQFTDEHWLHHDHISPTTGTFKNCRIWNLGGNSFLLQSSPLHLSFVCKPDVTPLLQQHYMTIAMSKMTLLSPLGLKIL